MAEPHIRRLRPDDLEAWHELRLEMLRLAPTAFGDSHQEAAAMPIERFLDHLARPNGAVFGAFAADRLIGSACYFRRSGLKAQHKGVLWGVYVRQEWRNGRIGERVVQAVIDHARDDVDILQGAVAADNHPARAVYRRLGFITYGVERGALRVDDRDYDEELIAIEFR